MSVTKIKKTKKEDKTSPANKSVQETPDPFVNDTGQFKLNMEKILAPVPGDNPAGISLRYEHVYDQIREARREDDASLPQGELERDLNKADWCAVRDLCIGSLGTDPESSSKDLQLAAWLLEAGLNLYGFEGVDKGLKIILNLCKTFWDNLYPEIDGDDFEDRVSPVVWLNEKLYIRIKMVNVTKPVKTDVVSYTMLDHDKGVRFENSQTKGGKPSKKYDDSNIVTKESFLKSAMLTPESFFKEQNSYLASSLASLNELGAFLDEKCGDQSPSLKLIRETIDEINRMMNHFYLEVRVDPPPVEEPPEVEVPVKEPLPGNSKTKKESSISKNKISDKKSDKTKEKQEVCASMQIKSREEAYLMLSEAADYLLKYEPHSPTPYLVKRAVCWGNMSLAQLLKELVDDEGNLSQLYKILGFKSFDDVPDADNGCANSAANEYGDASE